MSSSALGNTVPTYLASAFAALPHKPQSLEQCPEFPVIRNDIVRTLNEAFDTCQLSANGFRRIAIGHRLLRARIVLILFLELARQVRIIVRFAPQLTPQALRDALEADSQRPRRRRHQSVKAQQQQLPMPSLERDDPRLEQIARHVIVELTLRAVHRILEQPRLAIHERLLEKLLRLTAQRAL